MLARSATSLLLFAAAAGAADLPLVTFDGAKGTTYTWETLLDPVMGGQSNGTCSVKDGALVFNGYCAIVPKLKAPGFITAKLEGSALTRLADASDYDALKISLRSATPDYTGFKVSFAASSLSPTIACATGKDVLNTGCFKSPFTAKADWSDVVIPFSSFTDEWNPATGKPTGQHAPSKGNLGDIQTFSFWGEGVAGKVNLEVRSIYATNTAETLRN